MQGYMLYFYLFWFYPEKYLGCINESYIIEGNK